MKISYILTALLLIPHFLCSVVSNTIIATLATGVTPNGIAITPDSKYAYIANNNSYLLTDTTVTVLDLTNQTVYETIHNINFNEPYTITINPAGTEAFVTNSAGTTVSVIDIATNTITHTITGFDGPSGMAITANGTIGYVNNYGASDGVGSGNGTTVRVVNLNTYTISGGAITVGQAPSALALRPDGVYLYVINYVDGAPDTGTMSVIRTADNTVVQTITGFFGPFNLAITPDSRYAYVTNYGSNNFDPRGSTVSVVDLNSNTITATIELGIQPAGIAITPDGKYAYVSNYNTLYSSPGFTGLTAGQGTVNIIDLATNTVIPPTIAVDQSPAAIAITPNGHYACVSNYTSNTVNIIALQSFDITGQGCKIENRFLTRTNLVNKLTWRTTGTSLPVSYSVYRDAELTDLVGIVPATSTSMEFYDYNRVPGVTYTYYVIGTNSSGTTSDPITITVTQNC